MEENYKFGNLQIQRTEIPGMIINSVSRWTGEFWEELPRSDPDYSKAIDLMLTEKYGGMKPTNITVQLT